MTKRTDDQIPVIPPRGTSATFPARQPERTVTEDAVLQHENSSHMMISGGMLDGKPTRRLINVFRSSITDPVTNLFKRGTDTLNDVLDSGTYAKTLGSYLSANRLIKLFRPVGGHDVDGDLLSAGLAYDPENLLPNAGGQEGALNAAPTGWVQGSGLNMTTANDASKFGDRSLKIANTSAADTQWQPGISYTVADGDCFEFSGWIQTSALSGTGDGAYIKVAIASGVTGFTVLYKLGSNDTVAGFNYPSAGVLRTAGGGTQAWTFVRCVFLVQGSGTLVFRAQVGGNGTLTGNAWFDGLMFKQINQQTLAARLNAGKPWIDFTETIHTGKNLDNIGDGTIFPRTPQFSGGQNVVTNGNYEASASLINGYPPGWTNSGAVTFAYETGSPFTGNQSAKLTGAVGVRLQHIRKIQAYAGEVYKMAAALKADGATTASLFVTCRRADSSAVSFPVISTTSTSWTQVKSNFTVPTGTAYLDIFVEIDGATGSVWADEIFVTRVPTLDDEISDGATYGKTTFNQRDGGGRGFVALDANNRIVDQRRHQAVSVANYNSQQTSRPLSATGNGAGSGFITIAAHTVQYGWGTVSYNSGTINSLSAGTTPYQVYADDPSFAGGAVTYVASQDLSDVTANNGRYYVGAVAVPPTSTTVGASGGGGGSTKLH